MKQQVIDQIAAAGFDVWMRDISDTWLLFTDGKHIGYLQVDRSCGYTISTVHVPNQSTGTGFQVARHVPEFSRDILAQAFIHCPHWYQRDVSSVRKYRDMQHYCSENSFNQSYQLVAKGTGI